MQSIIKRTQKDYSLAFKWAVVDQVEKGEMSYKQAQDRYGIQGRSTVLVWLRKYGKLDWSKDRVKKGESEMTHPSELTPEQRIKELEQQLKTSQRRAEFFEEVVNILEQDYGLRVIKKPKGQPSRKSKHSVLR